MKVLPNCELMAGDDAWLPGQLHFDLKPWGMTSQDMQTYEYPA